MPRPRKGTQEVFYDTFSEFPLDEQAIALRIMTEIHRQAKRGLLGEPKAEIDLRSLDDVRKSVGKETTGN